MKTPIALSSLKNKQSILISVLIVRWSMDIRKDWWVMLLYRLYHGEIRRQAKTHARIERSIMSWAITLIGWVSSFLSFVRCVPTMRSLHDGSISSVSDGIQGRSHVHVFLQDRVSRFPSMSLSSSTPCSVYVAI